MSNVTEMVEQQDTAVAQTPAPLPVKTEAIAPIATETQPLGAAGVLPSCACQEEGAPAAAAPAQTVYVYALGRVRATASSLSVGQELQQANWLGINLSDTNALQYTILSQPRNTYLARAMCWIFQIDAAQALETATNPPLPVDTFVDAYILRPQTNVELDTFISALAPSFTPTDTRYVLVQGFEGPLAPRTMCRGLQLPLLVANSVYTFTRNQLVAQIQIAAQVSAQAGLLLDQMLQIAGNMGNTRENRAVNWLAISGFDVIAPVLGTGKMGFDIYRVLGVMQGYSTNPNSPFRVPGTYQFSGLSTSLVAESPRTIVNVVLHFRELITGTAVNWFCQVDVTGEFPFMARPFARYYSNP